MFFLATLLSFGWPTLRVEWIPTQSNTYTQQGLRLAQIPKGSHSMEPYIHGGEFCYIDYNVSNIQLGDLVSNGHALHMVVALNSRAVYMTGTNNRYSDGWYSRSNIQYIVRYIIQKS